MNAPDPLTDNDAVSRSRAITGRTGHLIIRLDKSETDDSDDLRVVARAERFVNLLRFLNANAHLRAERVVRHAPPRIVRERERIAARGAFAPIHSLTAYWRLDVRGDADADIHRHVLARMPEISVAYHETEVVPACQPLASASLNTHEGQQGFLDSGPAGVGARSAWQKGNCNGSGVKVIDIEEAWILDHEDLPSPTLLYGDNAELMIPGAADHGAAVLGVIGGVNNTVGVVGIAPFLEALGVVSHFDAAKGTGLHVADAIDAAAKHLGPGDILLLEIQRHDGSKAYPVETDSADLDAIRHAAAQGIVVVEAAGNGQTNLDAWADPTGQHELDRKAAGHKDSGAIMVGSSKDIVLTEPGGTTGHKRYYSSNYGSRVDVYAWGEGIYTAGYGTAAGAAGAANSYASDFGQTSGASAIIAGVAALLQSWHKAVCGEHLGPAEMRAMLANPATGTPQVFMSNDPIGVMPNLDAILAQGLPLRRRFVRALKAVGLPLRAKPDAFGAFRQAIPRNVARSQPQRNPGGHR